MIIGSYVVAVTLPVQGGQTLLLLVQIATVWLALRVSRARRGLRLVVTGPFVLRESPR
jgi:hypothetical protein